MGISASFAIEVLSSELSGFKCSTHNKPINVFEQDGKACVGYCCNDFALKMKTEVEKANAQVFKRWTISQLRNE